MHRLSVVKATLWHSCVKKCHNAADCLAVSCRYKISVSVRAVYYEASYARRRQQNLSPECCNARNEKMYDFLIVFAKQVKTYKNRKNYINIHIIIKNKTFSYVILLIYG